MSYIEDSLFGASNSEIKNFLVSEGFKEGRNPIGYGDCMLYVASGNYVVWFSVHEDVIRLYAEYDCGGEVGSTDYEFDNEDMDSFMEAYKDAVDWTKSMIN